MLEALKNTTVIADKGYDSNEVVAHATTNGCTVVIPSRSCRKQVRQYDPHVYRERFLVENLFQKLKRCRRVAMRFEKLAQNYLAMVQLAAILIWLA